MKKKRSWKEQLWKFIICAVLSFIVIVIDSEVLFSIQPLKELQLKQLDENFRVRGKIPFPDSAKVVIVEITQNTYNGIPVDQRKWPWPREFFAKVVRNLNAAGAKAVGIDILMSSENIFSEEDDSSLINAIRESGNVVVAGKATNIEGNVGVEGEDGSSVKFQIKREAEDYGNVFFFADSSIGIVQVVADNDGVHRRYLPFMYSSSSEELVPSFGFALVNKALGLPPQYLSKNLVDAFVIGDIEVPKFDNISMLINFYGASRTFPHFDFINILDDSEFTTQDELEYGVDLNIWDDEFSGLLHSGAFKDKIVLIGSTMEEDRDVLPVSFATSDKSGANMMYGVEFHANAIQSVLDRNFIRKLNPFLDYLLIIVLIFGIFYGSSYFRELKTKMNFAYEILAIVLAAGLFFGMRHLSYVSFVEFKVYFSFLGPALGIVLAYFSSTAYFLVLERRQKAQIKGMFSQYVDMTIVDALVSDPEKLRLGGEKKELTVFFSDIAGFSTFSESKDPEDLVKFLNEYLSAMSQSVMQNKGTLDKFIGDAVMAFWGAPIPQEDHAFLACKTAIEQQRLIREMREKWKKEGQPLIDVRIGINSGPMVVGNVGGTQRFDYTVMGDNVNLASRLEGANKPYGTNIMISETTYEYVKDQFITRELDHLVVKGKTKPLIVYELIDFADAILPQAYKESIDLYCQALAKYKERDFMSAIDLFKKAISVNPDESVSKLYLERAHAYLENPPPDNWDGVFIMKTK